MPKKHKQPNQQQLVSKTKSRNYGAKLKVSRGAFGPTAGLSFGFSKTKHKQYAVRDSADQNISTLGSGYAINFRPSRFVISSRKYDTLGECTVVSGNAKFATVVSASTITTNPGVFGGTQFLALRPYAIPRLAILALLYVKYRFTKIKLVFVTSCAVTTVGNFVMTYFPDGHAWNDSEYTALTFADLSTNSASAYVSVKEPMGTLTVGEKDLGQETLYYNDYHTTGVANSDVATDRQSIQGSVGGIFSNVAASTTYGDIFLEYECELYEPVVKDPTPLLSGSSLNVTPFSKNQTIVYDHNPHPKVLERSIIPIFPQPTTIIHPSEVKLCELPPSLADKQAFEAPGSIPNEENIVIRNPRFGETNVNWVYVTGDRPRPINSEISHSKIIQ